MGRNRLTWLEDKSAVDTLEPKSVERLPGLTQGPPEVTGDSSHLLSASDRNTCKWRKEKHDGAEGAQSFTRMMNETT